jgi:hypothetical protein
MSEKNKLVKALWKWVAPLVGLAAIALACFFYFHSPGQNSYRLSLTAGNALGTRHQLGQRLQKESSERSIALALRPSEGSEQALDWVNERKVDLALVQGGLTKAGRPNVRQVAALPSPTIRYLVTKHDSRLVPLPFGDTSEVKAVVSSSAID